MGRSKGSLLLCLHLVSTVPPRDLSVEDRESLEPRVLLLTVVVRPGDRYKDLSKVLDGPGCLEKFSIYTKPTLSGTVL